jgi:hypothetical protein
MAEHVTDEEERALIRARLLAYAEQHRLRPQRFCNKMAKMAGRDARYYARSTLFRFLGNIGETEEQNVTLYKEFLEHLPPPATLPALGTSLHAFYPAPATAPSPGSQSGPDLILPPGTHHTYISTRPADLTPYSILSFTPHISPHCFRVEETVTNPDRKEPTDENSPATRIAYEGIALLFGAIVMIIQRHAGTRHARTIHIAPAGSSYSGETRNFELTISEIPYLATTTHTPDLLISFSASLTTQENPD